MELSNAGLKEDLYLLKRIKFCKEFINAFPNSNKSIISYMLREQAESHARLRDIKTAENIFDESIKKFPDFIWGYIYWGDMYAIFKPYKDFTPDLDKAEKIYRKGLVYCKDNEELEILNDRLEDIRKLKMSKK